MTRKRRARSEQVSETRAEVIRLLGMFKRQTEIAAALGISRQAVHQHVKALRQQNNEVVKFNLPERRVPAVEAAPKKPPTKRRPPGVTRADVARLLEIIKNPKVIAAALGIGTRVVSRHINVLREQEERMMERKMVEQRIMRLPTESC